MSAVRFVISGEWEGRLVHRQVYQSYRKKLRAWAEKTHAIAYTDGTLLRITVRDCKPREKVTDIRGYSTLIEDCAFYDVRSVDALKAAKAQRSAA